MNHQEIRFCPHCGTPIVQKEAYGMQRPVCPSCNWVYFQDPKVAAACLVFKDHQVLLVQRSVEPGQGKWSLPAGYVNAYEDPARAAERECSEETGILINATDLVKLYSGREQKNGADIVLVYRGIIAGGELCPGDDAKEACFFSLSELPPLAFRSTIELLSK